MSQVKHEWLDGKAVLDSYFRCGHENEPAPRAAHQQIGKLDLGSPDKTILFYEFDEAIAVEECTPMAVSMMEVIYPWIQHPRWHRGHDILVRPSDGLKQWLHESLLTPLLAIKTPRTLYLSTPDAEDAALILMRCENIPLDSVL